MWRWFGEWYAFINVIAERGGWGEWGYGLDTKGAG